MDNIANSAFAGGAVYISGNGSFVNCNFTGNSVSGYGGAVYIDGNGSFINSTFTLSGNMLLNSNARPTVSISMLSMSFINVTQ